MSGGSMNYVYCEINNAAYNVQQTLANYELRRSRGIFVEPSKYDQDAYPNEEFLKSPKALMDETIKNLQYCLETIRKAAICAERVEWLTSDDDDESSFCLRLREELSKCEQTGGVQ